MPAEPRSGDRAPTGHPVMTVDPAGLRGTSRDPAGRSGSPRDPAGSGGSPRDPAGARGRRGVKKSRFKIFKQDEQQWNSCTGSPASEASSHNTINSNGSRAVYHKCSKSAAIKKIVSNYFFYRTIFFYRRKNFQIFFDFSIKLNCYTTNWVSWVRTKKN